MFTLICRTNVLLSYGCCKLLSYEFGMTLRRRKCRSQIMSKIGFVCIGSVYDVNLVLPKVKVNLCDSMCCFGKINSHKNG